MVRATWKWLLIGGSLVALGPALGWAWDALARAGDGGPAATALANASPVMGLVALLAAFVVAGGAALLAARTLGERSAYFAAGFALAGPAWASGSMADLLRWTATPRVFWTLAAEGLIAGGMGAALAVVVARMAAHALRGERAINANDPSMKGVQVAFAWSAAVVAGAAGAWLVAREPTAGQGLAAGIFAGVAAAFAAALVAGGVGARPALGVVPSALAALAVIGPLSAGLTHGADGLRAVYEQRMAPLGLLMPLQWVAGGFLGAPLGLSLAASMIERHQPTASAAR